MYPMNLGGILSGRSILEAVQAGDIHISPLDMDDPDHLLRFNPASFDLTLGSQIAVYTATTLIDFRHSDSLPIGKGIAGEKLSPKPWACGYPPKAKPGQNCLDSAIENEVARFKMTDEGFVLLPGIGYLMHTAEKIHSDKYVPILDGKSSIGRLFCSVHETAGFGDPGFDGQYTLEVAVIQPLIIYPGMRFCQIRFHSIVGEVDSYSKSGNYKGTLAEGPVPSRSWKMFNGKTKSSQ